MRQIEDYPNYYVTEDGEIYSSKRGIILKGGLDRDGYKLVTLQQGKQRRTAKVHREVAKLYVDNPNNLPIVNHIDGVKLNNHPSNLEWTTISGNTKHAYKLGTLDQRGEKNNACLYSDEQVQEVIAMYRGEMSISQIAEATGIKYATVRSYVKGLRRSQSSTTIPSGSTSEAIADGSGATPKGV